jgi:cytochrome P450
MRVISDMLGFPLEDGPQFREFIENTLEGVNLPPDERIARVGKMFDYLLEQIRDHVEHPRDDLTSYLLQAELYGRKLDPFHVAGTMSLLLIAGIDTSWGRSGRRCGTWPARRPTGAGWRRIRRCCRPRWRSSCAPTRR